MFFCSVPCWDAHLPEARHRDAWAEHETAPRQADVDETPPAPERRIVRPAPVEKTKSDLHLARENATTEEQDILVVVSKLKKYIDDTSGMNTSGKVPEVLSDHLRRVARASICEAEAEGRKTVLERDVTAALDRLLRPSTE